MQDSPRITARSILIICICTIALGSAFAMSTFFKSAGAEVEDVPQKSGLKKMIVEKALGEYERWRKDGKTLRETDTTVTSILQQYWKLGVIPVTDQQLRNSSWQYRHPWSAVFISWVMLQAGAGPGFPYGNAHSKYIVWARENATQQQSSFAAYDVSDLKSAWPEPGDLICMNRQSKRYSLQSITDRNISHCDIVTEVNKEERYLVAVGGNVTQTVNKRKVWLDPNGFIDLSRNYIVLDEEENNPEGPQSDIFGIIKVKE